MVPLLTTEVPMSDAPKQISPAELQDQVAEYSRRQPDYKTFADALKAILENARRVSFPDAFV